MLVHRQATGDAGVSLQNFIPPPLTFRKGLSSPRRGTSRGLDVCGWRGRGVTCGSRSLRSQNLLQTSSGASRLDWRARLLTGTWGWRTSEWWQLGLWLKASWWSQIIKTGCCKHFLMAKTHFGHMCKVSEQASIYTYIKQGSIFHHCPSTLKA